MSRSVLITGANSGIGLVTALELARAGYDVIGTARSAEKAERITAAGAEQGLALRTVLLQVDDAADCRRAVQEVAEMPGGGPWALVNNAGFAQAGTVEDVDDDLVRAQLETNLVAPLRLARLVLPGMRERGDGRIVNISSIAGRVTTPLMGWYCASKHGLEAVSDALRMEVEGFGVRVVLVEPGMFGTDVWDASKEGGFPPASTPRYQGAYDRANRLSAQTDRLPDPVWVARTVRVALGSPVPLPRYLVGVDAVTGRVADALAPTAVTDWVKTVATGLRPLVRRGR